MELEKHGVYRTRNGELVKIMSKPFRRLDGSYMVSGKIIGRDGTMTWYCHGGYTQYNIGHKLDIVDVVDEYETLGSKEQTT